MSNGRDRKARQNEVAKVKEDEGSGTVPNVTEDEIKEETSEADLKNAMHELEETKGDWSKGRG
jgi:hypothetical protein